MGKKKDRDIKKIKANTLARGMSLFNMTVSSSARFASLKLGDLFVSKDERRQRFEMFLSEQAHVLVEELGRLKGSIMKAGQMLSVYGEHFLPPEVNRVLKMLQAESRPLAWEEMHKVLVRQLGEATLAELEIDQTPMAAASMGQVYRAKVKATGEVLALKVQYPGVDQAIDSDLKALRSVLSLSHLVPKGPSFDEIFKEIRMMLHYEADYRRELAMVEQYRHWLADDPRYVVPLVYPRYSSKRVLAMSCEEGVNVDSAEVGALAQERRNRLGAGFMELMFKEVFLWRCVQTDPHFGNYRIRLRPEGDQIVLLDFGAVRKFPRRYIAGFAAMVHGAVMGDAAAVEAAATELGFLQEGDDEELVALFVELCFTGVEAFASERASPSLDGSREGANPYDWGQNDLMKRLTVLAKNAVFTFKLRTPPREAVFLDRKMVGTYICLTNLRLRMGPRALILSYLEPWVTGQGPATGGAGEGDDEGEEGGVPTPTMPLSGTQADKGWAE